MGVNSATLYFAGEDGQTALLDFVMRAFSTCGLPGTTSVKMSSAYAVAVDEDFATLMHRQIQAISWVPFAPAKMAGTVEDIGVIYNVDTAGRKLAYQMGPMAREQWALIGGPKIAPLEGSLPHMAWGIVIWDRMPFERPLEVQQTRRAIEVELGNRRNLVARGRDF